MELPPIPFALALHAPPALSPLIQCVPNFSEGRDPQVIGAIVDAVRAVPQVRLADWSADPDHNRLVVTFVGPPGPVLDACRAAGAVAAARIDLTRQHGVHPRLGAMDVVPLVPLARITLEACAALARTLAEDLARTLDLPVFLYEAALSPPRSLPFVRKEAFQTLTPDFGPSAPHPTAGAAVVGARRPLIAFNVNLADADPRTARRIARELRDGGGAGFSGVRALGLMLASRGQSQVSMNITAPQETSLLALVAYLHRRAGELGTEMTGSELIGALPGPSARDTLAEALHTTLRPGQVLWDG